MRILYLTENPTCVGTTRILRDWLLAGREAGWNGAVCVSERGELTDWLKSNSFSYVVNRMPWLNLKRPWSALAALRLANWIRLQKCDLIQCNEHQLYPFATSVARLTGLPVVCHVRCKLSDGFARWAFSKREPDALIWCTRHMASECAASFNGHVRADRQHIVPLGLRISDAWTAPSMAADPKCGKSQADIVVGMACFIRPGKRIEDFLSLADRLRQAMNVRFALAGGSAKGDEQYFRDVRGTIERHVARGTVQWLGHVEPIDDFLNAIDVFVSTSEHESFGMSVCEAMACGKPVVAYRGGSVAEVVGDAGLIVETGDLDGLTAAVERLILNTELRLNLGATARERVAREFDPSKSFETLQSIYSSLLGRSNGRGFLRWKKPIDSLAGI